MPSYTKHPKRLFPLTEEEFIDGMKTGKFVKEKHRGFCSLLYHTGVRVSEALRALENQFVIGKDRIHFDVRQRLKNGLHTAPLPILLSKPFCDDIVFALENTDKDERVFPYCRMTGYLIVDRVFLYPHHLRLSKITMLFRKGFTIDQVRSWTGHKELSSLTAYVGFSNVEKMAEA